jgi:hypothetical protein
MQVNASALSFCCIWRYNKNMSIYRASPSQIGDIIAEHIREHSSVFVFPTDIACTSWAEWTVSHSGKTGVKSVAMEQFIAWDTFKSSLMNAKVAGKTSIPALLRKIFVRTLIAQNEEQVKQGNPLFRSILNPSHAENAYSFTDWISGMLPSLSIWHDRYETWLKKNGGKDDDEENGDYLTLYTRYSEYLEKNGLFEPAWITPDFTISGGNYFIFYPETLEDYSDYKEMMENASHVTLVMLPETAERPVLSFYSNSRTELRLCALRIRKLVEQQKTSWNGIAVSVSDIETWRPYIEREFSLYCIPFVIKSGEPYTENSAGRVFREIQDCVENGFSYESVRALLLDGYIPWKDRQLNENLVREGSVRRCICSYKENGRTVDPWETALDAANTADTTERELTEYRMLRQHLENICNAVSFQKIREAWFAFRSKFLDDTSFTRDADLIIGRCLMVLSELIDIEKKFLEPADLSIPSPYAFYLNELENSSYQKQSGTSGVKVFSYRTSSCAHFDFQFVLDCSQKQLTVPFRSLSFLNKTKREALLGPDTDSVSDAYVRLYSGKDASAFSASQQTFGGFAIPYSLFAKYSDEETAADMKDLVRGDFITAEKECLSGNGPFPKAVSSLQKNSFEVWRHHITVQKPSYAEPGKALQDRITYLLEEKRNGHDEDGGNIPGRIHIAQTDLRSFYPCRRYWLFSQVLKLSEDSLDTSLMDPYDPGTISHRILELFMTSYMKAGVPLPVCGDSGVFDDEDEIREHVISCAEETFHDRTMNFAGSPLAVTVLESQKELFADTVVNFLHSLCAQNSFGGYTVKALESWMNGTDEDDPLVAYTGKIDCILMNSDGEESIVDYKNSANSAPKTEQSIADEEGKLEDFQMPLYVTLWTIRHRSRKTDELENALFAAIRQCEFRYVVEREPGPRSKSVTLEQYKETVGCLRKYSADFAAAVKKGDFEPVSPAVTAYTDCGDCTFSPICRTTYISSGIKLRTADKEQ